MGGGGGTPAQQATYSYNSPFQNPAYTAVAMGTKKTPGPLARSIQIGNQMAQNWQDSYTGANPGAYYGVAKDQATPQFLANQRVQQGAWSPPTSQTAAGVNQFDPDRNRTIAAANPNLSEQTAKSGGIMSLGNFEGGESSDSEAVNPQGYAKGGAPKPQYNARSPADQKATALQTAIDSGYKPKPAETRFLQGFADSAAARQQLGASNMPYRTNPKTGAIEPAARGANQTTAQYQSYLTTLDNAGVSLNPKDVKKYGVDTRAARQARGQNTGVGAPYSMQQAIEQQTAYFDPTTGESTNPLFRQAVGRIQEAQQLPEQFGQATNAYNQALAGLSGMTNYSPQQVEAAKIARGDIRDIEAKMANVERMQGAREVEGSTMSGPQSWTQQGVARQYMNPYTQNVLDQELFEANRQAQQRENQQRSQAAQQKAFGGTRAALQESEGRRNLGYLLSDIESKGLQQAYGQGMQQFQQEQGLGQQAKQTNVASLNQAALANQLYGTGGFQAQAANQAAQNQAYNNYVQQQLTAAGANQGMDWNTASQNATMQMQAMLANQQAGLQANQQNIGAYGQMLQGAQGLGSLGAQQAQTNLANIGALGQAAQAQQGLAQQYLTGLQQSAQNYYNWPQQQLSYPINAINQLPSSGGYSAQTQRPASALGWKKGGLMNLRKARRV